MSVIKKTKKIIESSTLSVGEFKSWISGVEDMQGVDWHPSPEQWKKIRAKIAILSDGGNQIVHQHIHSEARQSSLTPPENAWTSNQVVQAPPTALYSEIDLNKTPGVITGDYTPAFM